MRISISDALTELGISAIVQNNNYESIQWFCEESEIPSKEIVENKIAEMQSAEDAIQYRKDRAVAYPSIQDQLDMQYHDQVNGTSTWKDSIAKVKSDNPKPS